MGYVFLRGIDLSWSERGLNREGAYTVNLKKAVTLSVNVNCEERKYVMLFYTSYRTRNSRELRKFHNTSQ